MSITRRWIWMPGVLVALLIGCAPTATRIQIPRLEGIRIDGVGGDWGEAGYRAEVFSDTAATQQPASSGSAKMRLGWDSRGILVLLDVRDDKISESNDASDLKDGDCVQFLVFAQKDSPIGWHGIVSPGIDSKHAKPRWQFVPADIRLYPSTLRTTIAAQAACTRVRDGYVLEALLPWSNLGVQPALGQTLAMQVIVNDFDPPAAIHQLLWHPQQWDERRRNLRIVELADRSSPPGTVTASADVQRLRTLRVRVDADGTNAGKTAQVREGRRVVAEATLKPDRDRSPQRTSATMSVDLPPYPRLPGKLAVYVRGEAAVPLEIPDLQSLRENVFANMAVHFEKTDFETYRFPRFMIETPAAVQDMIGMFKLNTAFYDTNGDRVGQALRPGRYCAVVEFDAEDGRKYRRYLLLRRTEPTTHPATTHPTTGRASTTGTAPVAPSSRYAVKMTPDVADDQFRARIMKKYDDLLYPYVLQLPADYQKDAKRRWPLLLALHGSGERGVDLGIVRRSSLPARVSMRGGLPMIVVSPQCPPDQEWSVERLNALLDELITRYRVDPDRVYLTGYSMGAYGAWNFAAQHGDRIAAIVPISGEWDVSDAGGLKDLPAWIFHGQNDTIVPVGGEQKMVDALKKLRAPVRFTLYPDAGHECWDRTYDNDELFRWMMRQKRVLR